MDDIIEDMIRLADHSLTMWPIPLELVCYHCQQSAEKYLKVFLMSAGVTPPYIHDLPELLKICKTKNPHFAELAQVCSQLTGYGTQPRYPMEIKINTEDMNRALAGAKQVQEFLQKEASELFLSAKAAPNNGSASDNGCYSGNYTEERREALKGITIDQAAEEIAQQKKELL
jgi:HEPN domain-containing protein